MRYSKNEGKISKKDKIFRFTKSELNCAYERTKLKFLENGKIHLANPKQLTVYDTENEIFEKIQKAYLKTPIFESLVNPSNFNKLINLVSESGGKSSSFIFVTTDYKFVIKTITKHEFFIFKDKLLQIYSRRILECKSSKLVRIFALLALPKLDQYVIIMENLIHKKEESFIFDLKGSKVGRNVKDVDDQLNPPQGIALKDVNFEQFGYKIPLHPEDKKKEMGILTDDFLVMKNAGIMDYSILICIRKNAKLEIGESRLAFVDLAGSVITLGIIDIFQEYNICKLSETAVKTLFNKPIEVSSIEPAQYFYRIKEYLSQIFI